MVTPIILALRMLKQGDYELSTACKDGRNGLCKACESKRAVPGRGGGDRTAVRSGLRQQHLDVPQMMPPEAAPGVYGRLRAGEEYSAQVPCPVWPKWRPSSDYDECGPRDLATLSSKITWRKGKGKMAVTGCLTPGRLAQAAPVTISLSLSSAAASSHTLGQRREDRVCTAPGGSGWLPGEKDTSPPDQK